MNKQSEPKDEFLQEVIHRGNIVRRYLNQKKYKSRFTPPHIRDAVFSYLDAGGKSLRPAVLMFSCGAVGGDEKKAIPASAGIEIFHTWTLVHDDIIDRDSKRRGGPTVHEEFRQKAIKELKIKEKDALHYGMSIGIMAGDVQHGWAISLFSELGEDKDISKDVVLYLIRELDTFVLNNLLSGEALDVQYSKMPIESLTESEIIDMLRKKTGVLYEFAGKSGAMIGLNSIDEKNYLIKALPSFTKQCGIAFQLQDDILGIVGDENKLGKPIGSDIREGKRTTIVYYALNKANRVQKKFLINTLGNQNASISDIHDTVDLLVSLGGVRYTQSLAEKYIEKALKHWNKLPESKYKKLLFNWAEFMINRKF